MASSTRVHGTRVAPGDVMELFLARPESFCDSIQAPPR
jgi:hypothetical protein